MLQTQPVSAPKVAATNIDAPEVAEAPIDPSNPYGALVVDLRSRSRFVSLSQGPSPESFPGSAPAPVTALQQPENAKPSSLAAVLDEGAPLPPRRPPEFGLSASSRETQVARTPAPQNRQSALAAAPSDNRPFIEKLFGNFQSPGTALAYAAPETGLLGNPGSVTSSVSPRFDRWTAVYDISAHTVYLPNGAKLEAHSGLGDRLDDPRYVHERMRGATPPNVYELTPREQPFHGVRALRLTPVGGGSTFGRAGLLAHTYMLGVNGDSNGCVSFKNYQAFLQAYENGEIKRLAVIARRD